MSDHLVRCVACDGRVRLVAADASNTVEELRRLHDASPTMTAAMGRVAVGALLLVSCLEKITVREPMLTIEVEGGGPAGRLVATTSPAGWVRAFVGNPHAEAAPRSDGSFDVPAVVGSCGHLVVTRDVGIGQPYRGVVAMQTGEIAQNLAQYLNDSEQSASAVVLGVSVVREGRVAHAGGYLVQLLPGFSSDEAERLAERVRSLGPLTDSLARGQEPLSWLGHLLPSGFQVLERTPVRFLCGCSMDRVERALRLLGAGEIRSLLDESLCKPATLTCEFCKTEYQVDRDQLSRLLLEVEQNLGGPN